MNPSMENPTQIAAPTVTVVVCTHNRSGPVAKALDSLINLHGSKAFTFEILVIDNASTDNTREVIDRVIHEPPGQGSLRPPVRYACEPSPGVAHARNRGVQEALGEWIAFFDDDQIADPNWLNELFGLAVAKNVFCVGGRVELRQPPGCDRDLGPVCRDLLSETINQPSPRRYDRRFKPGAGNLLIHRTAVEHVGGFDTEFNDRGEDTILFLKMHQAGYESWYTPDAIVYHAIPAERLTDDAFLDLTRQVARRLPIYEKAHWQHLFPAAWAARILQTTFSFAPQLLFAKLSGDRDRLLEARCQFLMARVRIGHGVRWLFASHRPLLADAN
jgi:glycosyltransferase involved in cell wall biosynthesis